MNKNRALGFALFFALLLGSCAKEGNVVSETTPQVENHEVSLSFFEETIVPIGANAAKTRGDEAEASALKKTHLFSDLQACLIPKNNPADVSYKVSQDSTQAGFGKVELKVPYGEYTLVAVAANTKMNQDGRINIESATKMTFANDYVRDLAYVSQDLTIAKSDLRVSKSVPIKRAVSSFVLQSSDNCPDNAASAEFVLKGSCGKVFNPATGFCTTTEPISRTIEFDPSERKGKLIDFTIYALLSANDASDISVTATMKDKAGNVIKVCSFDNVHLVVGMKTIYTGPIFTFPAGITFSISNAGMGDSGYGITF